MTQYVKDSTGQLHPFDDNATDDQIRQELTQKLQSKPEPQPPARLPGATPGGMQPLEGAPDLRMVPIAPEAERYRRMGIVGAINNNRTMGTVGTDLYKHDPSYLQNAEAAKGAGKAAIELAQRQAAGTRVVPGIGALRKMVAEATDEDWSKAAGPYNNVPQPAANTVPFSREAWRAPDMTPTQARANYGWNANDPDALRQWNLQNDLEHLGGALTEQYITAMGKGAIANSDAKMNLFKDLMGRLRYSTDRKSAMRILDTAEDATHNTFSLDDSITPGRSAQHPMRVRTPEEAKMFRAGTWIMTPDGRLGRVPPNG